MPQTLEGKSRVIDGDSLRVAGEEVRLVGIDAPEGRQNCERDGIWSCGREAARRLRTLIAGRTVVCDVENVDRYDRLLAVCSVASIELNHWMVANGWAVSYGRYLPQEQRAKAARRGIWSSRFERPRDWRDRHIGARAAQMD